MIGCGQAVRIVSHEIRHNRADASLSVIEHNRCTTSRARAQFQRSIGILIVEWLTIQPVKAVYPQITVIEENDVSAVLPGNAFADRAMADVVVYRLVICVGVNMVAPPSIFV